MKLSSHQFTPSCRFSCYASDGSLRMPIETMAPTVSGSVAQEVRAAGRAQRKQACSRFDYAFHLSNGIAMPGMVYMVKVLTMVSMEVFGQTDHPGIWLECVHLCCLCAVTVRKVDPGANTDFEHISFGQSNNLLTDFPDWLGVSMPAYKLGIDVVPVEGHKLLHSAGSFAPGECHEERTVTGPIVHVTEAAGNGKPLGQ